MHWNQLLDQGEKGKLQSKRTPFDRDFDRIIFSYPFRKLQDKTQVHPLPEQDFVHNRLTHSLEVSSVGRSLGKAAGEQLLDRHSSLKEFISANDFGVITASASLAHDIGNPPFGHSGEDAISDYFISNASKYQSSFSDLEWADLCSFEGNAQGFRLLNKSGYQGLKLTAPTLAAFTKYPRPSKVEDRMKPRRSQKKYGYFQSEKETFQKLVDRLDIHSLSANQWVRHPLAFLVEAADDICYNIIDLEDGFNLGLISHKDTVDFLAEIISSSYQPEKLRSIPSKIEQIAVLRALAIGKLIQQAVTLFLDNEEAMLSGTFDTALADLIPSNHTLEEISKVSMDKIYRAKEVLEIEAAGFNIVHTLLDSFVPVAMGVDISIKDKIRFRLLPEDTKHEIEHALDTYSAVRYLLDFISGMTDRNAMSLYRKITGISLPGNR